MEKSEVQSEENLTCHNCGQEIYYCDECENYFNEGNFVYCDEKSSKHFCKDCGEKFDENIR